MSDYHSTHTGNIIDAAISAVIAGQAGIQGVKVNGVELTPDLANKVDVTTPEVVQTTGTSTTTVMSQKAITDELNEKSELHTYYVVADKDNWVGQSAPYTQVFDMSSYTIKGDVFFADLGSEITVDSLEDWSCISSVDVTGNVVTLTCLEDKPKNDLVVYLRGFTS